MGHWGESSNPYINGVIYKGGPLRRCFRGASLKISEGDDSSAGTRQRGWSTGRFVSWTLQWISERIAIKRDPFWRVWIHTYIYIFINIYIYLYIYIQINYCIQIESPERRRNAVLAWYILPCRRSYTNSGPKRKKRWAFLEKDRRIPPCQIGFQNSIIYHLHQA